MKCPLMLMGWESKLNEKSFEPMDCLQEGCAWWDDVTEQCCFKTLTRGIVPIINDLKELVKKMPHIEEFPLTGAD